MKRLMKILINFEAMAAAAMTLWVGNLSAGVNDLRITEIDPGTRRVEVTHVGATGFTTTSSLPFCHRFNYFTSIPANTTFGPNESKVFVVSGLNATDSDIWLYRNSVFTSAASIITGMKYGPAPNVGRTGLAASVGLWPGASAFVPAPPGGRTLRAISIAATSTTNWFVGDDDFGSFTPPEIRILSTTATSSSILLEFSSPLPASFHRLQSRTSLAPPGNWLEVPQSISNSASDRFSVVVPKSANPHEFFRIQVP